MTPDISPSEKLKIIAYEDPEYQTPAGKEYEAVVNPNEIVESSNVNYSQCQGQGTTGTELKFNKIPPNEITFNLLFDATGVLIQKAGPVNPLAKPEPLNEQLDRFKEIVKGYDGTTHNTYYLKIIWGVIIFHGKLTGMQLTYSTFRPDGRPMRAYAKVTFTAFKNDKKRISEEGKNSPDLTHIRTVKAGDTLPLMTYRIYGDFSYYLEVARVNELKDYRNLEPGTQLFFPPLDKQTA